METWRYDLTCPWKENMWETGFGSYDDAYEAMSASITEIIDEVAEEHPEMSDVEIEAEIDWDIRPE